MGRFLTLMVMMILGALAQPPSPYFTKGMYNGVTWKESSYGEKAMYVDGAYTGFNREILTILQHRQLIECLEGIKAATPAWLLGSPKKNQADVGPVDVVKEMDTFYQDGANVSIPMIDAFVYAEMILAGASKEDLDQFRKTAIK